METQAFKHLYHCTYALQYHLVFVTKYRKRCLTAEMSQYLKSIYQNQLELKEGALLEFNSEEDHVHLLIELPPKVAIAQLVNNLKTVSSRLLRKAYAEQLERYYFKPVLWSRSYFAASCGGAPLAVIKQYIQQQESPQ